MDSDLRGAIEDADRRLIGDAEAGDTKAAKELLTSAWYVHENGASKLEVLDYLFRCIGRHVLDGFPLDEAFGIKGGKGRPLSENASLDMDIAVEVCRLIESGLSVTSALHKVADDRHKSYETTRKIYYDNENSALDVLKIRTEVIEATLGKPPILRGDPVRKKPPKDSN
jgi:hypothetical protein